MLRRDDDVPPEQLLYSHRKGFDRCDPRTHEHRDNVRHRLRPRAFVSAPDPAVHHQPAGLMLHVLSAGSHGRAARQVARIHDHLQLAGNHPHDLPVRHLLLGRQPARLGAGSAIRTPPDRIQCVHQGRHPRHLRLPVLGTWRTGSVPGRVLPGGSVSREEQENLNLPGHLPRAPLLIWNEVYTLKYISFRKFFPKKK